MTKKKNADNPPSPVVTTEGALTDVLTIIKQFQPEFQNELISKILEELAKDRYHSAKVMREEADRAARNLETFMTNAIGLEKILAEKKVFN